MNINVRLLYLYETMLCSSSHDFRRNRPIQELLMAFIMMSLIKLIKLVSTVEMT